MSDAPLLDLIAQRRAADIAHERVIAASGTAGCVAHRERLVQLRTEQLADELGFVRCRGRGWRGVGARA